ncbi:MAG: hypothetical protein ACI9JO_000588, partial [Psychrobacter okhotskensis]
AHNNTQRKAPNLGRLVRGFSLCIIIISSILTYPKS